jgi:hypothetical protein
MVELSSSPVATLIVLGESDRDIIKDMRALLHQNILIIGVSESN